MGERSNHKVKSSKKRAFRHTNLMKPEQNLQQQPPELQSQIEAALHLEGKQTSRISRVDLISLE